MLCCASTHPPSLPVRCQGRVRSGRSMGVIDRTAHRDWLVRNTINALLLLWDDLHQHSGLSFLLTSRLNQDCVENLFSIFCGKGGHRDNPDPGQFRQAFRQVMVDAILLLLQSQLWRGRWLSLKSFSHAEADASSAVAPVQDSSSELPESMRNIFAVMNFNTGVKLCAVSWGEQHLLTTLGYISAVKSAINCAKNVESNYAQT